MDEQTRQRKERALWDKSAAAYDQRNLRIFARAYALSIEKARAVLSPQQHVLEIGCGTGIISLAVAPYIERIVATDISAPMVAAARSKAEEAVLNNIEFLVHDGYALPYPDGTFDTVLLFNTLHVVQEPGRLLAEACRLLKPAGYLVTSTDCYAEPVPLATRLMLSVQKLLKLTGVIPVMWYYKKQDLVELFEQAGLTVVETDVLHAAPVNCYLLARKAPREEGNPE